MRKEGIMQQQMHTCQDMDPMLERQLDEGEELLWSGYPGIGNRNSSPQKRTFITLIIIYGIIGIVLLFVSFMLFISRSIHGDPIIFLIIGSIFFLLAIFFGAIAVVSRWPP